MKAVIEDPNCTQSGNSGVIEGDLILGKKYDAHTRTNVASEDVVGAPASLAVVAQKKSAATPRTKRDTT
jgi:hypothetical protein